MEQDNNREQAPGMTTVWVRTGIAPQRTEQEPELTPSHNE
jgi:hypothetical protein